VVCRSEGGRNRSTGSVGQSNLKRLSVWQPGAQQRCSKNTAIMLEFQIGGRHAICTLKYSGYSCKLNFTYSMSEGCGKHLTRQPLCKV